MKNTILTTILFLSFCHLVHAETIKIKPITEGFISGQGTGTFSLKVKEKLMTRSLGRNKVMATFILFEIPQYISEIQTATLFLEVIRARNELFTLYATSDAGWMAETLSSQTAPGWNVDENNVNNRQCIEIGIMQPYDNILEIPLNKSSFTFLNQNLGKDVTFILVSNGSNTSSFHSSAAGEDKGPYFEIIMK